MIESDKAARRAAVSNKLRKVERMVERAALRDRVTAEIRRETARLTREVAKEATANCDVVSIDCDHGCDCGEIWLRAGEIARDAKDDSLVVEIVNAAALHQESMRAIHWERIRDLLPKWARLT